MTWSLDVSFVFSNNLLNKECFCSWLPCNMLWFDAVVFRQCQFIGSNASEDTVENIGKYATWASIH